MFRFSMENNVQLDTNPRQLATANITPDEDFAERLKDTDEYRRDEQYYRAENESPASLGEAIEFVQGIFFHPPRRVWLDGALHEVKPDDLSGLRKPHA